MLCKDYLKDPRLSFQAKGMIAYMLMVSHGTMTREELAATSANGVSSVRSTLSEMEKYGYLERHQNRDEKGRIEWEYSVTSYSVKDNAL